MPNERVVGSGKSKTERVLQLLRHKRKHEVPKAILPPSNTDMLQMAEQKEPEEKYELETIHAISSMESFAATEDIPRDFILHAKIGECTCEEPYVGKPPVRFREGFHNKNERV